MKKVISILMLAVVAISMNSCTTADSSEVAVVVDQIGNDKGVPVTQIKSGLIFYFPPTQDVFLYPTSIQHKVWCKAPTEDTAQDESIAVTSADGATFGLDVSINVQLKREEAANVFKKYRVEMPELIGTRIRTLVRKELLDNAVNFASDSSLQHRNIFEANVNKSLAVAMDKEGFILNNVTVLAMDIPKSYRDAINKKIQVIQQTATIRSQTIQAEQQALQKVAVAKGNYEAAQYDSKTKEIMSQPKLLDLYKAETDRIRAQKGVSIYGNNNVFGAGTNILLSK